MMATEHSLLYNALPGPSSLAAYRSLHNGYHAIPPQDQLAGLRTQMSLLLEGMGVPVKYHHHEVGGPGQCEIETPLMNMVAAADAVMTVKYVAKMAACAAGQTVTFLPKPLYGEAGSGMHFHQHLFCGAQNLFYDPDGYSLLSKLALCDENIFDWSAERRASIKGLPTSLVEALDALSADHAFLLEGDVFPDDLIADWIRAKRAEYAQVQTRPHPFEVQMYFDL